jgi:hexosaminidase
MKRINPVSRLVVMVSTALVVACGSREPSTPKPAVPQKSARTYGIIPVPRDIQSGQGVMRVAGGTAVVYVGDAARASAQYFVDLTQRLIQLGLSSPREGDARNGAINFVLAPDQTALGDEGYSLVVRPDRITITAAKPAGLFYGGVTLWQVMTGRAQQGIGVDVPVLDITDAPRFAWRGLMLDSVRHFQSVEYVKQFIDWMALHKLNVLHWHLTDDQGWRVEIKKYPRLTSVGGWRVPAGAAPRADIDPKTGKPRVIGGFYTQDQIRDVVAYAAARHINVVPEIEMPGHASAAVVAYPQLGVVPAPKEVPSDWGIYPTLFNVEESTFTFLEDVLAEVIELFPSPYIHVGGDEALKDQWRESARVQARMKELGVKDEHELQSYFIQRMEKFINSKGRKLIGWDEILEGGLAPNATVMSWRGIDGAIAAAAAGHDTVLSPAPDLYLDHWQSPGDLSPGRSNTLSLEMVYKFNPMPGKIPEAQRKHILGLQANLWAEFMRTEERVTYMAYPRVAAVAEIAWSPAARIDWQNFQQRLEWQLRRYDSLGIRYAREVRTVPGESRRVSHDLEQCGEGYLLSLEDDAPIEGERAVFLVNISNPCWIWRGADLTRYGQIRVTVGQIPFNFQIGKDAEKIPLPKPTTPHGEFELRLDRCDGPRLDFASLQPAVNVHGLTRLPPILVGKQEGKHDLCFQFTRSKVDPIWVISSIELLPRSQ